jgi:signal transduction histidine kinase
MNSISRAIHIISADGVVAQSCLGELATVGSRYEVQVASTVEQARDGFARHAPVAIFLDESAVNVASGDLALEPAVTLLTKYAPVVVAAAPGQQTTLAFLITSGAVDFVSRTSEFLPIVAGMLDRRARMAERFARTLHFRSDELPGDFGEILRHEVNNPLTGILGNTELLLARRDRLPPVAIERLETIAELAVRLRETVRRLSNAWEDHHEQARPA